MDNSISTYQFDATQVRVIHDGEPKFCLPDICRALGMTNPSMVASRINQDDLSLAEVTDSLGRKQKSYFVTEAGMYEVVIRSDRPEAAKFRSWVTHDVLPSIRKHGAYLTPEAVEKALTDPDFIIRLATQVKEERAAKEQALAQIEQDRPHTLLGAAISANDDDSMVKAVADSITQSGVPVNQNQLYAWMRTHGWVCSRKGDMWNMPTKHMLDKGMLRTVQKLVTLPNGKQKSVWITHVTGKGQADLVDGFLTGRYRL